MAAGVLAKEKLIACKFEAAASLLAFSDQSLNNAWAMLEGTQATQHAVTSFLMDFLFTPASWHKIDVSPQLANRIVEHCGQRAGAGVCRLVLDSPLRCALSPVVALSHIETGSMGRPKVSQGNPDAGGVSPWQPHPYSSLPPGIDGKGPLGSSSYAELCAFPSVAVEECVACAWLRHRQGRTDEAIRMLNAISPISLVQCLLHHPNVLVSFPGEHELNRSVTPKRDSTRIHSEVASCYLRRDLGRVGLGLCPSSFMVLLRSCAPTCLALALWVMNSMFPLSTSLQCLCPYEVPFSLDTLPIVRSPPGRNALTNNEGYETDENELDADSEMLSEGEDPNLSLAYRRYLEGVLARPQRFHYSFLHEAESWTSGSGHFGANTGALRLDGASCPPITHTHASTDVSGRRTGGPHDDSPFPLSGVKPVAGLLGLHLARSLKWLPREPDSSRLRLTIPLLSDNNRMGSFAWLRPIASSVLSLPRSSPPATTTKLSAPSSQPPLPRTVALKQAAHGSTGGSTQSGGSRKSSPDSFRGGSGSPTIPRLTLTPEEDIFLGTASPLFSLLCLFGMGTLLDSDANRICALLTFTQAEDAAKNPDLPPAKPCTSDLLEGGRGEQFARFVQALAHFANGRFTLATDQLLEDGLTFALPECANHFCKQYEEWQTVVSRTLECVTRLEHGATATQTPELREMQESLRELCARFAMKANPAAFLAALPADGAAEFFLPLIQRCFIHSAAKNVKQILFDDLESAVRGGS
eukprot:Rmarinus@m.16229